MLVCLGGSEPWSPVRNVGIFNILGEEVIQNREDVGDGFFAVQGKWICNIVGFSYSHNALHNAINCRHFSLALLQRSNLPNRSYIVLAFSFAEQKISFVKSGVCFYIECFFASLHSVQKTMLDWYSQPRSEVEKQPDLLYGLTDESKLEVLCPKSKRVLKSAIPCEWWQVHSAIEVKMVFESQRSRFILFQLHINLF